MTSELMQRVAVCSWSLQPSDPQDLVRKLNATGIRRVQLALDPLRESPAVWGSVPELLKSNGYQLVSGMLGCVGEDYSTLESIRHTGGVTPDQTWEQNKNNALATARQAKSLGLKLVTFHSGFVPHDSSDPKYRVMVERLQEVADAFGAQGIALGLETGQETAPDLSRFLQSVNRPNVCVNFDPANMILYDKGNPIEAVKALGRWIRQVHIKDALRTGEPGTWGEEVPAGTGEVEWPLFFQTLAQFGFQGDYVIEREAGNSRVEDIKVAVQMLQVQVI